MPQLLPSPRKGSAGFSAAVAQKVEKYATEIHTFGSEAELLPGDMRFETQVRILVEAVAEAQSQKETRHPRLPLFFTFSEACQAPGRVSQMCKYSAANRNPSAPKAVCRKHYGLRVLGATIYNIFIGYETKTKRLRILFIG